MSWPSSWLPHHMAIAVRACVRGHAVAEQARLANVQGIVGEEVVHANEIYCMGRDTQPTGDGIVSSLRLHQIGELQMSFERRYRKKMPPRFTTKVTKKRGLSTAPSETPNKSRKSSNNVNSPQPSNMVDGPELPEMLGEEEGTSHGSSGLSPTSECLTSNGGSQDRSADARKNCLVALPCDCSGNCQATRPCCPSRRKWSTGGKHRCPNPAEKIDKDAVRHFCRACRCVVANCSWPRRRGIYCSHHRDHLGKDPAQHHPGGWFKIEALS